MTNEGYKRANRIQDELSTLERWFGDCANIQSVKMHIKRLGGQGIVEVPISDELSDTLKEAIRERISTLHSEFESL